MTRPAAIDAWMLEAEADPIRRRGDDTNRMLSAWANRHGLKVHGRPSSEILGFAGAHSPGDLDRITLTGEISGDQISELTSQMRRVYAVSLDGYTWLPSKYRSRN